MNIVGKRHSPTSREGRLARARGCPRGANPYLNSLKASADSATRLRMEWSWNSGWDQADTELSPRR